MVDCYTLVWVNSAESLCARKKVGLLGSALVAIILIYSFLVTFYQTNHTITLNSNSIPPATRSFFLE